MVNYKESVMKRDRFLFLLVFMFLFSSACFASNLEEGLQAYGEKNYAKALSLLRPLATLDNSAEAQNYLGKMYHKGFGVNQDYKVAMQWYQKAADQGNADAQFALGLMAENEKWDYKTSIYWYLKAAKQGYAKAQYNLASIYSLVWGRPNFDEKIIFWCRKAAEQGLADAQYYMGTIYESGQGVTADAKAAIAWYLKAAHQGHTKAQYNLAVIYSSDWSESKDYKKALFWYHNAAEQGHSQAQSYLAYMYSRGIGTNTDFKQAQMWSEQSKGYRFVHAEWFEKRKLKERSGVYDICSQESYAIERSVSNISDEHIFQLPSTMTTEEMVIWLTFALQERKFEVAKKAVDLGANPNALVACSKSSIFTAVRAYIAQGSRAEMPLDMLMYLVKHGYVMETESFETVYQSISSKGTTFEGLAEREQLKKLYASVKTQNPSFYPSLGGSLSFIGWLIQEGIADPNKLKDRPGNSIRVAISGRDDNLARVLIENGASVLGEGEMLCQSQDTHGHTCVDTSGLDTPLYYAVEYRSSEIVRLLLKKGAGVYSQHQLDKALEKAGLDSSYIKERLLQAGAKLTKENECDALECFSGLSGEGNARFSYRNKTIAVYEYASESSKKTVWEVDTNKVFEVGESRVHTIQYGIKEALEDFSFECGKVKKGEYIKVLRYESEGYYTIKYNQTYCSSDSIYGQKLKTISDMISESWVQLENDITGEKGWVIVTEDNFVFHDRSF